MIKSWNVADTAYIIHVRLDVGCRAHARTHRQLFKARPVMQLRCFNVFMSAAEIPPTVLKYKFRVAICLCASNDRKTKTEISDESSRFPLCQRHICLRQAHGAIYLAIGASHEMYSHESHLPGRMTHTQSQVNPLKSRRIWISNDIHPRLINHKRNEWMGYDLFSHLLR